MRHLSRRGKGALAGVMALAGALILLLIIINRPPADPLRADAVVDPPFTSLTYSIQTGLWWDYHLASLQLEWARLMVFSHIKQVFAWEDIEPGPGLWQFERADQIVDEVEQKGLRLVVRLSDAPEWAHPSIDGRKDADFIDGPPDAEFMDDWGQYCGTVAARYRGRVAAYQIWNEPNLMREWGNRTPNAAAFTELLRVCSEAIHAADPDAIRISAGLSPTGTCCEIAIPDDLFLQQLYDAGFQRYIDVVGMHAPGYASSPLVSPDEAEAMGSQRFFVFRRVEDLRRVMVANDDAARQAAILEFGWTTDQRPHDESEYAWFAVTEAQQAEYMVQAYQYAAEHWRPWMGLMSVIYMADPAWTPDDEEYWWSIVTPGGEMRQADFDLANMAKYCGERVIPARAPDSPEALGHVTVDPCD